VRLARKLLFPLFLSTAGIATSYAAFSYYVSTDHLTPKQLDYLDAKLDALEHYLPGPLNVVLFPLSNAVEERIAAIDNKIINPKRVNPKENNRKDHNPK